MMFTLCCFLALSGVSIAIDLSGCKPNQEIRIYGIDQPTGDIYSPGYKEGENYPDDVQCGYSIATGVGYRIKLTFKSIDIEDSDGCYRDALRVDEYPFSGGEPNLLGIFCGNQSVPPILSEKEVVNLQFMSDYMIGRKGFHIQYSVTNTISSLCKSGQKTCKNRSCYSSDQECDGTDDCGDGSDEENCGYPPVVTDCGVRDEPEEDYGYDRVIGGREAKPGSWPWQADLQTKIHYPNGHVCGGTLINSQWLMTAAHCISPDEPASVWRIHLGKHNKFIKDDSEQIRYVERIIIYPNFTGDTIKNYKMDFDHDMTLMKLNAPVKFTKRVRPACLPSEGYELAHGTKCWASGWGTTRGSGHADALKEVELTILDKEHCPTGIYNENTMICSQNADLQGLCNADSGGPLHCKYDGKWHIMGPTSFGSAGNLDGSSLCALPNNYGFFNKASKKTRWIREQINKYS